MSGPVCICGHSAAYHGPHCATGDCDAYQAPAPTA